MRGATRGSRCFMLFAASSFGAAFRSLGVISGRIRARTMRFLGNRSLRSQNVCFLPLPYQGKNSRFSGIQCECLTRSAVSATKFERELDSPGLGLKFWYHICFTYSCWSLSHPGSWGRLLTFAVRNLTRIARSPQLCGAENWVPFFKVLRFLSERSLGQFQGAAAAGRVDRIGLFFLGFEIWEAWLRRRTGTHSISFSCSWAPWFLQQAKIAAQFKELMQAL
jgi:hypothetical protein